MLYCNEDLYKNHIDTSYLSGIDLWIARYNYKFDLSFQRNIWQSSCKGIVELVTGVGDRLNLNSMLAQYVSLANIFSNVEIPEL